jgi:hypothetical protein
MEHPGWESAPRSLRLWTNARVRVTKAVPFLYARAEARHKKIGPQHCDKCGQLLGERMYLVQQRSWLFRTEESTKLCPPCMEQEMERLKQAGLLPKGL